MPRNAGLIAALLCHLVATAQSKAPQSHGGRLLIRGEQRAKVVPGVASTGGDVFLSEGRHAVEASRHNSTGDTVKQTNARVAENTPRIVFGIKSGASEFHRRQAWRASNCSKIYASQNVEYKFFLGEPYAGHSHRLDRHDQGGRNTSSEQQDSRTILDEVEKFNDIVVLPMRDQYMSLPEKTFSALKFAVDTWPQTQYVGLHDVEYCMRPEVAQKEIEAFEAEKATASYDQLFAGIYYWNGTEYKMQKGPGNETAPYFSGHGYFMSRALASTIVSADRTHSILYGVYGTASEDADLGKWVQYAEQHHNGMATKMAKAPKLLWTIENMPEKS